jgi:hypothetical protein
MKSNINIIPLRTWSVIPKSWDARPLTVNYDKLDAIIIIQMDGVTFGSPLMFLHYGS